MGAETMNLHGVARGLDAATVKIQPELAGSK